MLANGRQIIKRKACVANGAFTLIEVVVSIAILAMVMAGIIFGYVQANRAAEWSSMSLAAQSLASQGMEQVRAAQWNSQTWPLPTNSCLTDQLWVSNYVGATWSTKYSGSNYAMDIPATGAPFYATNLVTITTVQVTPPLRMIRSDCIWRFPVSGVLFTNTVITYRAPDQ